MNKKYKLILKSGVWLLLGVTLIVSMSFVNHSRKKAKCTGMNIKIGNDGGNYFVEEDDIREFIYAYSGDPIGMVMNTINLKSLEEEIASMDAVRNAEVFTDLKGGLSIEVDQRIPIARIYFKDQSSVYLDDEGELMPLSKNYTARVIVVNGNIPPPYLDENAEAFNPQWTNLNELITTIQNDEFLQAQFEQIYVNENDEFELIPRVGRHSILLGKGNDINKKFKKLKLFYKEGISKVDWNKYKLIDLRFNDQIVCAKR